MKKLQLCLFLSAVALTTQSCEEDDPCAAVMCGPNGTCEDGSCLCASGYELATDGSCNMPVSEKFIGSYNAAETCVSNQNNGSATDSYSTMITAGASGPTSLTLNGIYLNVSLAATVNADGSSFSFGAQTVDLITYSDGEGTIDPATGVITLTFTPSSGGASESCTLILTPQ